MIGPDAATEIGIGLQGDKDPGTYAALAQRAEAGGVDVITVFNDLGYQPAIAPLLEIAAATSTVRLGCACWNPYAMAPYEIAAQVATLDAVSDGRAYLGLARGGWLRDVGISQVRPLTAIPEAAEVVRRLLAGDRSGFAGTVFPLAAGTALQFPRRRDAVPVLVGTWGRRMAAAAGGFADEVKVGGCANPDMVAVMRDWIAVGERHVGRPEGSVGVVIGAVTVVDEDREVARSLARTEVAMYLDVVGELDPTTDIDPDVLAAVRRGLAADDPERAGRAIPDGTLDRFAFAGTPEDVAAHVGAIAAAGAARVELGTPQGVTTERGVALIVDRVIPLLQG